jgi:hypothetical protein
LNQYDLIDSMSPKITCMTGKNIVGLKKFQDNIFFLKKILKQQYIESTWVNLGQLSKSVIQVMKS